MDWLLALLFSLGLSHCAHKKSNAEKKLSDDKPNNISEGAPPNTGSPVPNSENPTSSANFDIEFVSISGFSGPQITFKPSATNASNVLAKPYTKIQFKACSKVQGNSLPPILKECVSGYTRNKIFSLPIFSADFSLDLSYCTDEKCTIETREEHNPDSLDLGEKSEIKVASLFVEQNNLNQSLRASASRIYKELQPLLAQDTQCPDLFKQSEKDSLQDLSKYSLAELEELFLTLPVDNFVKALSREDKVQILESMPDNTTAQQIQSENKKLSLQDLDSIFFLVATAYYSVTGVAESAKELKDLYAWNTLLHSRRTVVINGKTVTLVRHSKSGFLVEPQFKNYSMDRMKREKAKFYMEDPTDKKVLKDKTDKADKLLAVSPEDLGVKYSDGRFYKYDYKTDHYTIVDYDGKVITSPDLLDRVNANIELSYKREVVVLNRVQVKGEGQRFGGVDLSGNKPNFLDSKQLMRTHNMTVDSYEQEIKAKTMPIFQREETPFGNLNKVGGSLFSAGTTAVKIGLLVVALNELRSRGGFSLAETQSKSETPCTPDQFNIFSEDFKNIAKLKTRLFLVNNEILTSI